MKNFILILITLTTIYAQTSAVDLYEQSQKALSTGNIELAGEKIRAAIEADKSNDSFRKEFDRLNGLRNKMINSNRSVKDGRFDDASSNLPSFTDLLELIILFLRPFNLSNSFLNESLDLSASIAALIFSPASSIFPVESAF